jgi:ABC-2 type transport system permease protein
MNPVYLRYELLRTFRNRRYVMFAILIPVGLYFATAGPNRGESDLAGTGLSAPLYFMVGLAAFGGMNAVVSIGGRIAAERSVGWTRELRLTPLSTRGYFRAKVATAYALALVTLAALYFSGFTLGVRLQAGEWVRMTGLMLIGLVPFVVLGIFLGHVLTAESTGPAIGGITALFALLGGAWFPIQNGVMHDIAEALPSFWLVQASHVALGGPGWTALGWFVVAAWTVALGALAARAYGRDTKRL